MLDKQNGRSGVWFFELEVTSYRQPATIQVGKYICYTINLPHFFPRFCVVQYTAVTNTVLTSLRLVRNINRVLKSPILVLEAAIGQWRHCYSLEQSFSIPNQFERLVFQILTLIKTFQGITSPSLLSMHSNLPKKLLVTPKMTLHLKLRFL